MINIKDPGAGKGGDAPAKKCPKCLALIHAGYAKCPECGYEFPPPEGNDKLSRNASTAGIISGQVEHSDYEVLDTFYAVHEKRYAEPGTPRTMRVDYRIGFNDFKSEWVCPEHTGYARGKFEKWWRELADCGKPGEYLFTIFRDYVEERNMANKVIWDVSAVSYLTSPQATEWEVIPRERLEDDSSWSFPRTERRMLIARKIDRDVLFSDIFTRLRAHVKASALA